MTELELEQAIRDYITILYKACYIGWLKVNKLNPGYKLSIGVPSYMFPTTIAGDFETDDSFLSYIYEELRVRNYMRVYFYQVKRMPSNNEEGPTNEGTSIDKVTCDPNYTHYGGISPTTPPIELLGFTYIFPFTLA